MVAISEDSTRIQVTLSNKLLGKIDSVCERSGMSRRAWIEYTLAMSTLAYEELIEGIAKGLEEGIPEGVETES